MCNGTKNVQRNKKCAQGAKNVPLSKNEVHKETMGAKCNLLWHIMVLNCHEWPYMASCGLVWPCMAFYDLVWRCLALYGVVWRCMALYGVVWP